MNTLLGYVARVKKWIEDNLVGESLPTNYNISVAGITTKYESASANKYISQSRFV
jgi:hypothetical protein